MRAQGDVRGGVLKEEVIACTDERRVSAAYSRIKLKPSIQQNGNSSPGI
jgi:hypothetical protein